MLSRILLVCACVRDYELFFRCLTGIQAKKDACAQMAISIRVPECNRKIGQKFHAPWRASDRVCVRAGCNP